MLKHLTRWISVFSFLMISSALLLAFYWQLYRGVMPCSLCILQRVVFLGLAVLWLVAILVPFTGRVGVWYFSSVGVCTGAGIFIAGKQVWMQHFPAAKSILETCSADSDFLLENFPLFRALQLMFTSMEADCARVGLRFLGLSIAEWALFGFVVLCGLAITNVVLSARMSE